MNIDIKNPKVAFDVDGKTQATFDFFELEEILSVEFEALVAGKPEREVVGNIRTWMLTHGLPETVNIATVKAWVLAYNQHLETERKKTSGSLS